MAKDSYCLPYFPLDVHLDNKFKLIEAEFGIKGFAIVVKLYQKIYGEQGYYCEFTSDVGLLFSREINEGYNLVSEIVNKSIERGLFDKNLFFKYSILTSKGIQKTWLNAMQRRKSVEVDINFWLITAVNKYQNVNITYLNVNIKGQDVDILPQSREEKSRVEKSISTASPFDVASLDLKTALKDFEQMRCKIKKPLTDRAKQMIIAELNKLSTDEKTQIAIINQSVLHNWQTVYELKNENKQEKEVAQNEWNIATTRL